MKPIKQTVYLPLKIENPTDKSFDSKEGYFFTPEQLNKYTANVVRQALETAAEKVKDEIACDYDSTEHYNSSVKPSITNTFEETYKKYMV